MIANYLIYLNTLPKEEKFEQILIIIIFFFILIIISILLTLLKLKLLKKFQNNKNSAFDNFLNIFHSGRD